MKFFFIFGFLQVVLYTTIANNIQVDKYKNYDSILKLRQDETSIECKYINYPDDCCKMDGITCENGHITEM